MPNLEQNRPRTSLLEALFANNAALVRDNEETLQRSIDLFVHACGEFSLTINIKKTEAMGQGTDSLWAST